MNCILIEVSTDEGITGYGEAYDFGAPLVVKTIIEEQLRPSLIGKDPTNIGALWNSMYQGVRSEITMTDNRGQIIPLAIERRGERVCAMSGIEIALWDIYGKYVKQPVYKILGEGGYREKFRTYASKGGWMTAEELAKEASDFAELGFTGYKIAWGMGRSKDVQRLKAVREAVGDDFEIMLDCHGTLSPSSILRNSSVFEKYDVSWIEEPIFYDSVDQLAELRRKINTPIAAGESESTRYAFTKYLELKAVDIVQPDACITGGLAEARNIALMASAWNILCAPHVWSNAIGIVAALHFAAATPNTFIFEVPMVHNTLRDTMLKEPLELRKGYLEVPKKPGLGIEIDEHALENFPFLRSN